jgi:hypothetical protein
MIDGGKVPLGGVDPAGERLDRETKGGTVIAAARVFLNSVSVKSPDIDVFKTIAIFCGVGLLILLLLAAGLACLQLEPQSQRPLEDPFCIFIR